MKRQSKFLVAMLCLGALVVASAPAFAALEKYDAPSVSCVDATGASITVKICAGASGAPAGVSLHWMKKEDWEVYGWNNDDLVCELSLSGAPSMQHPSSSRWDLPPNGCQTIIIGDLNFDETGLGVDEGNCAIEPLECGTEYVFRAFAHGGKPSHGEHPKGRSAWSDDVFCSTDPCEPHGESCTFTQGFWRTHGPGACDVAAGPNYWPVANLKLGTVDYAADELCSILWEPAKGNGLIFLAHQLIAAKFNRLTNASLIEPACGIDAVIAAADAMIGGLVVPPVGVGYIAPADASALNDALASFNEGGFPGCPGHCPGGVFPPPPGGVSRMNATPIETSSWGRIKVIYR